MSLLYEALLKNNQNKLTSDSHIDKPTAGISEHVSAQAPPENGTSINSSPINRAKHSDFLTNSANINKVQTNHFLANKFASVSGNFQQGGKHIPSSVWIFIGSLLLVVGLLAGYIYGNALLSNNQAKANVQVNTQSSEIITSTESVNTIKTTDSGSNTIPAITESAVVNENSTTSEGDDKTVEIALDPQGQVISKVSELTNDRAKPESAEIETAEVKSSKPNTVESNLSDEQVLINDVPDKLKASFAEAIKATERQQSSDEPFEMNLSTSPNLLMLDDLTGYQVRSLPNLIYQMHLFSSDVSERWVRINGITLYEGYELQQGLTLLEIKQDLIVWRFNNIKVGQLALVDFIK